jgi:hypothetical protein
MYFTGFKEYVLHSQRGERHKYPKIGLECGVVLGYFSWIGICLLTTNLY